MIRSPARTRTWWRSCSTSSSSACVLARWTSKSPALPLRMGQRCCRATSRTFRRCQGCASKIGPCKDHYIARRRSISVRIASSTRKPCWRRLRLHIPGIKKAMLASPNHSTGTSSHFSHIFHIRPPHLQPILLLRACRGGARASRRRAEKQSSGDARHWAVCAGDDFSGMRRTSDVLS